MKVLAHHHNFQLPIKSSEAAGGYDLFMPEDGQANMDEVTKVPLGFSSEIPEGYIAMLLPRSGAGAKFGLELNNTCGIIDADYRGEWIANLKTKQAQGMKWKAGDRILQYILVPVLDSPPERVHSLTTTFRGIGGFGSTGV